MPIDIRTASEPEKNPENIKQRISPIISKVLIAIDHLYGKNVYVKDRDFVLVEVGSFRRKNHT
jgi:hypothetical protein